MIIHVHTDCSVLTIYFVIMATNFQDSYATCDAAQTQECRDAALNKNLGTLSAGGQCSVSSYGQHFTHLCDVKNYLPNHVDYCCCEHAKSILCCRYYQDWNHFRCSIKQDSVGVIPPDTLSLEILLPAILGPVAILVCCIICCVKCWCYRYEEDGRLRCCWNDDDPNKDLEKVKPYTSSHINREEQMPLTYGPLCNHGNTGGGGDVSNAKQLIPDDIYSLPSRPEPSAPPCDEDGTNIKQNISSCIARKSCALNRNCVHCPCSGCHAACSPCQHDVIHPLPPSRDPTTCPLDHVGVISTPHGPPPVRDVICPHPVTVCDVTVPRNNPCGVGYCTSKQCCRLANGLEVANINGDPRAESPHSVICTPCAPPSYEEAHNDQVIS